MFLFPNINGSCRFGSGEFILPQTLQVCNSHFEPDCVTVFAHRTGLVYGDGAPWLKLLPDASLPAEGYRLEVTPEEIRLSAASEAGITHGLTTVYLACSENRRIPVCRLEDAPKHPHRGLSLDTVRHFIPLEEIQRIIEQMARVKLNVLHLHLSDDQGWRIQCNSFPKLHQINSDYYTRDQLQDLVHFAKLRGIRIIPEIDLPGHTTAILAAYPELGCTGKTVSLATTGGIYNTILCAGSEKVYTFLENLLEEVCRIFPDPEFHIGGDEAPKGQWCRCPRCQEKLASLNSTDYEELQSYFTTRICRILQKYGKTPVCWNETLKGSQLPDDLRIQFWTLDGHKEMLNWAKNGRPFVFSSMYALYLDYPYAMTGIRKLHRMRPGIWLRPCRRYSGFLGIEAALWGEHIATARSREEHLFPRLYLIAEKAWSGGDRSYRRTIRRLEQLCSLANQEGICTMPRGSWNPAGATRRQEALDFFRKMNGGILETDLPDNLEPVKPNLPSLITYVTRFFRPGDLPALAKHYFK